MGKFYFRNIFSWLCRTLLFIYVAVHWSVAYGSFDKYEISIQLEGANDSVLYLANYYGDKTYLTDTAYMNRKGVFVFEGDSVLPGGIYIIAGQSNNKYFELIVEHDQKFSVQAEMQDVISSAKIKGSEENELFFNYISQTIRTTKALEKLKAERKKYSKGDDLFLKTGLQIKDTELKIQEYKDSLVESDPKSLLAGIIKAMIEVKPKNVPVLENGRKDSIFLYNYYKNHYWDNFDLTDERLLRTPLFHKKLENYFGKVIYQDPDTIVKEADKIIEITRTNKETFKYVIWYLTFKFETSKIMGFDEIFVHMVDSYYAKGEAFWADSSLIKSLTKRAYELHNVLIGNPAKNLILLDTNDRFRSLYHEEAPYIVVLFYEYDCSHCHREIDALKKWYENNEIGFEVFAVSSDTSLAKWKKFVRDKEMTWINVNGTRSVTPDYHHLYDISITPTLFLLDNEKKIIAKRIKTGQLKPFLENYHRNRQRNN
ncbi:MAG: DUF5106 domain-containing protein [Bacteroidales bacterium]|nr:DUF5106 domain-containing protein [Bacteroidales bacterium]